MLTVPLAAADTTGRVLWVYDGDTLKIENIGKVRLLGIDVPETKASSKDRFYRKRFNLEPKKLRQIARQAKHYNIRQVKNRRVRLTFDKTRKDKYNRLLAYVYLPNGEMLNQLLLENGLATVFRRYNFELKKDFLKTEKNARKKELGLWKPQL